MKILIINTFYEGTSTGKIASGFYKKLIEHGHQCKLLYGSGEKSDNPDFYKIATAVDIRLSWIHNQFSGIHGHFAPSPMKRVFRIIDEFCPDIVQLYNLHYYYLDIYRLFDYLKKKNIPTVYGMLDEYPYLGYCCYSYECEQFKTGCEKCNYKQFRRIYPRNIWRNGAQKTIELKRKAYANFNSLIFTGPEWVVKRAKESFLLKNKNIKKVDEFVENETIFVPQEAKSLYEELAIPIENKIILNVAPSRDPRKGVSYYVSLARKFEGEQYTFIHVGYQGSKEGLPSNFIPIPFVRDQVKLAQFYSLADLFVCTSIADTMPNVCLDALSCGTPVLGFAITGIPYVAESPCGRFVQPGDIEELEKWIRTLAKKTENIRKICRQYAIDRYSPNTYYKCMLNIYQKILGGSEI